MIDDLDDGRKRDFDQLAVGPFDFHTRRGQRLGHLHAAHDATHTMSVLGHDFDVAFAVKGAQGRESFGNFHLFFDAM